MVGDVFQIQSLDQKIIHISIVSIMFKKSDQVTDEASPTELNKANVVFFASETGEITIVHRQSTEQTSIDVCQLNGNKRKCDRLSIEDASSMVKKHQTDHSPIDQQPASQASDKSNETILCLTWSTKNKIIKCLNAFTAILYGQRPSEVDEKHLIDEVDKLMITLSSLQFKSNGSELNQDDLVLDLGWTFRNRLVIHLITNKNYSIANNLLSDKMKLIDENNCLVSELMKLPVSMNEIHLLDSESETSKSNEGKFQNII